MSHVVSVSKREGFVCTFSALPLGSCEPLTLSGCSLTDLRVPSLISHLTSSQHPVPVSLKALILRPASRAKETKEGNVCGTMSFLFFPSSLLTLEQATAVTLAGNLLSANIDPGKSTEYCCRRRRAAASFGSGSSLSLPMPTRSK